MAKPSRCVRLIIPLAASILSDGDGIVTGATNARRAGNHANRKAAVQGKLDVLTSAFTPSRQLSIGSLIIRRSFINRPAPGAGRTDRDRRVDRIAVQTNGRGAEENKGEHSMSIARRDIDFHSGEEVIADIEHLRKAGYEKTKNWNLTQVCQHLAGTMNGGMDGFGFRLPWILRATVVKWVFAYSLKKRKLMNGAPTFPSLQPKAEDNADDDAVIDHCIETIRRAISFDGSMEDYALLDNLSVEDWRAFMWLHASHHLSFLVPSSQNPNSQI